MKPPTSTIAAGTPGTKTEPSSAFRDLVVADVSSFDRNLDAASRAVHLVIDRLPLDIHVAEFHIAIRQDRDAFGPDEDDHLTIPLRLDGRPSLEVGIQLFFAPCGRKGRIDMSRHASAAVFEREHDLGSLRPELVGKVLVFQPKTIEGSALGWAGRINLAAYALVAKLAPLVQRLVQLLDLHHLAAQGAASAGSHQTVFRVRATSACQRRASGLRHARRRLRRSGYTTRPRAR